MKEKLANISFLELLKKIFNYPIVLLTIAVVVNLRNIISSFAWIISTLFHAPLDVFVAIISFAEYACPVVLLAILLLHRFEKAKKANIIVGLFLIFVVLANIYFEYPTLRGFFLNFSSYDAYTFYSSSPLLRVIDTIVELVILAFLAVVVLTGNEKLHVAHYILVALGITVTLFFGILSQLIGFGGLVNAFLTMLYYIALWYIPKALKDTHSVEITPAKGKALIAIVVVVMFMFVVSGALAGRSSEDDDKRGEETCSMCGKTYGSDDMSGNFRNILLTNFCKRCEKNFHSLEPLIEG